ncbi:4Fe-4S binding protein [Salidesulfovibrio onnuriiensis]|uniref:4Fe-4S binding protein n=1 Tax=Salidesulfovibrio onnuriiensis TaxID=2583823 RepID=UPI0011CCB772|nr:4Fe-4S binding protein [Salidesulfovibrio onnuriiensis]
MKNMLLAIPALALLLLAAHHFRQGDMGMAAAYLLMMGLLLTRQGWVRFALVAVLGFGAYEWAGVAVDFIRFREALGAPWTRLAMIMGCVFLFNLGAMAVMLGKVAGERFERNATNAPWQATAFCLSLFGLGTIRELAPVPMLLVDRYLSGWGPLEILCLAVYAAWLSGKMAVPRHALRFRPRLWALFSLVFFAQLCLGLLGMEKMLMTGDLHLPVPALIVAGPVFRGGGYFMLMLFLATILLVGPAWCSHLCYIGAWDDLLSRRGPRPAPSKTLGRWSVLGRVITLIMVLAVAAGLRMAGAEALVAVILAAVFGLAGVGVMVLFSRRGGMMVHCSAFCPLGLVGNVLGRLSPWRMRVGAECDVCGACFARCRYNALSETTISTGQAGLSCTLCGDCVSACTRQQIGYGFPGLGPARSRALFLTLVASLHAVFLGVARM